MDTGFQRGDMRVSDAERDQAVAELSEAFQSGRLSQEEFSQRSDQAFAARTRDDLNDLFSDLPRRAVPPAGPAQPVLDDSQPRRGRFPLPTAGAVIGAVIVAIVVAHLLGAVGWLIPVVILALVARRAFRR